MKQPSLADSMRETLATQHTAAPEHIWARIEQANPQAEAKIRTLGLGSRKWLAVAATLLLILTAGIIVMLNIDASTTLATTAATLNSGSETTELELFAPHQPILSAEIYKGVKINEGIPGAATLEACFRC